MDFEKSRFHETYIRAAGAVAYVAVVDSKGDEGIGSCFHIGNGIFVTARHVGGIAELGRRRTLTPYPFANTYELSR